MHKYKYEHIYKSIFFIIIVIMFLSCAYITSSAKCSSCEQRSGKKDGECPAKCANGKCWVDGKGDWCSGHDYKSEGSSSHEDLSGKEKSGKQYDVYYTHSSADLDATSGSRQETRHYKQDYKLTYTITTTTKMKCRICGDEFKDTSTSSRTDYTTENEADSPITERCYRVRVTQYHQNTQGTFVVSDDTSFVSPWTGWTNCNTGDTRPESVSINWTIAETDTHHSADTHTTYAKSDTTVRNHTVSRSNPHDEDYRHQRRYVYRKRYWAVFYSNPQTKISTPVEYIRANENTNVPNPIDVKSLLENASLWAERKFTRVNNKDVLSFNNDKEKVYARLTFCGENYNIPSTYDLFQQYGYYSNNDWYSARQNGANRGYGQRSWVDRLPGWNDPNVLYVYNVYATWISEPGKLFLMPNSQFDLGTDSCYGAYIDNVQDNTATENVYEFNSKQ